jgi:hypothetical protein
LTLRDDLSFPTDVAIARNGDVYVTNRGAKTGIAVYEPGQTTVSRFITNPLITKPEQIFFDRRDTLYISDDNTGVSVRPYGGKIRSLGLQGLGAITSGVALDEYSGTLYVGDNSAEVIHVFPKGSLTSTSAFPIGNPNFIVVCKVGRRKFVIAPDFLSDHVDFFRTRGPGSRKFVTGAAEANGVAFQPADCQHHLRAIDELTAWEDYFT